MRTYIKAYMSLNFGQIPPLTMELAALERRKLPSIYVFSYFPFGFEGRMWDLIVSVPDHCLSFYFGSTRTPDAAYQVASSREEDFLRVLPLYGHSGHIGHVTWTV